MEGLCSHGLNSAAVPFSGVSALAAIAALPVAYLVVWATLRTRFAHRVVAAPTRDRWHTETTPSLGGVGIVAGLLAGVAAALALDAVEPSWELFGILAGCLILFAAGLVDDLRTLSPPVKIGAQVAAAAVVLSTGLKVQLVSNPVLGIAIALAWLIGMTNAFNLLDNMDGLAATLAAIGAFALAIDAVTQHPNDLVLVLSLAVGFACLGFLPFNLRLHGPALIFMGDSGSQVLGFALAALGLAGSWKIAGATVTSLFLPILILAVPILDTTLVTVIRLLEGRPVTKGGRDHASHRLVYSGLSEKRAVVFLAVISIVLAATSLAYNVLDDPRITLVGVLVTFALLVQFAGFLSDVERGPRDALAGGPTILRGFVVHRRRLAEVLVDFALITASFTLAYLLLVPGSGTVYQRHMYLVILPVLIGARYVCFIPFGLYRGVSRYAGARDALSVAVAVVTSELLAYAAIALTQPWGDFPRTIFVLDALIATVLVGLSRFWERGVVRGLHTLRDRGGQRKTLIVGAGRAGRSLLRELRETPGERVVGFVDDDPRLRRRRIQGAPVLGAAGEIERVLARSHPDAVLVTIPNAPRERLDGIVAACESAHVPCRFVRRETDLDPRIVLGAAAE